MKPTLWSSWYCPFAQRALLALKEKNVDFVLHEHDSKLKTPEFLAVNPRGLVPALVLDKDVIIESLIICEYVDEAWPESGHRLLPPLSDPLARAKQRILLDFVGKKIVTPSLKFMFAKDDESRRTLSEVLKAGLNESFAEASTDGPFFNGSEFEMIDIALAPFVNGVEIFQEFFALDLWNETEDARFMQWWKAVKERPSFREIRPERQRVVDRYLKSSETS